MTSGLLFNVDLLRLEQSERLIGLVSESFIEVVNKFFNLLIYITITLLSLQLNAAVRLIFLHNVFQLKYSIVRNLLSIH